MAIIESSATLGLLLLIDSKRYTVSTVRPGLDVWAILLHSHDTNQQYRIASDFDGAWHCTCNDRKYRPGKRECKHIRAARELLQLAKEITS